MAFSETERGTIRHHAGTTGVNCTVPPKSKCMLTLLIVITTQQITFSEGILLLHSSIQADDCTQNSNSVKATLFEVNII